MLHDHPGIKLARRRIVVPLGLPQRLIHERTTTRSQSIIKILLVEQSSFLLHHDKPVRCTLSLCLIVCELYLSRSKGLFQVSHIVFRLFNIRG
jgi:hypothetical protein